MNAGFSLSTKMFCGVPLTLLLYTLSLRRLIISCGPVYGASNGCLTWILETLELMFVDLYGRIRTCYCSDAGFFRTFCICSRNLVTKLYGSVGSSMLGKNSPVSLSVVP